MAPFWPSTTNSTNRQWAVLGPVAVPRCRDPLRDNAKTSDFLARGIATFFFYHTCTFFFWTGPSFLGIGERAHPWRLKRDVRRFLSQAVAIIPVPFGPHTRAYRLRALDSRPFSVGRSLHCGLASLGRLDKPLSLPSRPSPPPPPRLALLSFLSTLSSVLSRSCPSSSTRPSGEV